jgi:hypothetical protein
LISDDALFFVLLSTGISGATNEFRVAFFVNDDAVLAMGFCGGF